MVCSVVVFFNYSYTHLGFSDFQWDFSAIQMVFFFPTIQEAKIRSMTGGKGGMGLTIAWSLGPKKAIKYQPTCHKVHIFTCITAGF